MNRTITLQIDPIHNRKAQNIAIGYLATWCPLSYDTLRIAMDGKEDMIAYYSNSTDESKYTIGAVYRREEGKEDYYSFHS